MPGKADSQIFASCFFLGMKLIKFSSESAFGGEGFMVTFKIEECMKRGFREMKTELAAYFDAFYDKKAAPPLCIALCTAVIIGYFISNTRSLWNL
jgi:hypothetical protein